MKRAFSVLQTLLLVVAASAQAGPKLPNGELNLMILDLNGAPFRHFHINNYPGAILDHRKMPGRTAFPELELHKISKAVQQMPRTVGLKMPKLRYGLAEQLPYEPDVAPDLLQRQRRSPW